MKDTFHQARYAILSYLLSFPTLRHTDWKYDAGSEVRVGDLVALSSAPASKYYLGWLVEVIPGDSAYSTRYVIRSVEDGSEGSWHNVSINLFNRETTEQMHSWRWSDRQFDFNRRWFRVCHKDHDAYIVLPCYALFGEGYAVKLKLRIRHGWNEWTFEREFPDFRKVTRAMMSAFYTDGSNDYDKQKPKK
jgi:hypothetical protein